MLDLAADIPAFFAGLSESVTYTPHGGTAVTRDAIVERSPVRVDQHGGRQAAQGVVEVWIANHATLGVSSVKERFDKVALPEKVGGSSKTYTVQKILDQDAGFWHLECGG